MRIHVTTSRWRAALLAALVAVVVVRVLHLATAIAPAHAEDVGPTCTLSQEGLNCPTTLPPAALLGPPALAAATPAQAESLRRLSDQAIDNALTDHGLPASDRDAVASWGRADAQAELYALIVAAIRTDASARTADQQNAVDWMSELVRAKAERAAEHAGAEYAKWAGLDLPAYWRIAQDPSTTEAGLAAFLSTPVSPYNNPDQAKATSGYCLYQPPEAYRDSYKKKYDTSTFQTCYSPCTTPFGCTPVTPQYDDFVDWGRTAAEDAEPDSADLGVAWSEMAKAALFGGAVVSAVAGIVTTAIVEGAIEYGSILPFFASALSIEEFGLFTLGSDVSALGWTAAEAASVGGAVAIVIMAVVIATLEAIKVGEAAALPARLAKLVTDARTAVPDLVSQLSDAEQSAGIFALFVQATLPLPRVGGGCDGTTATTELGSRPCLNPTDVPALSPTDPHFVIRDVESGVTSVSPTITLLDPATSATETVGIHGNWLVSADSTRDQRIQSLGLVYPDPAGIQQRAWLVRDTSGAYWFAGVAGVATVYGVGTCEEDGSCWASPIIEFVGADGRTYRAKIEQYRAPMGTPSADQAVEGDPVTLHANGFAPAGAAPPVSYIWRFQKAGCGGVPCTTTTSSGGTAGGAGTGPAYGGPVVGAGPGGDGAATHTWETSGTYHVVLTATDQHGLLAETTFTVPVAVVPALLFLDAPAPSTPVGQPVAVTGTLIHAGTLDSVQVDVDWGDGSQDTVGAGPGTLSLAGAPATLAPETDLRYRLAATHVYAQPGDHQVSVTVTNQAGQRTTRTVTLHVL